MTFGTLAEVIASEVTIKLMNPPYGDYCLSCGGVHELYTRLKTILKT